DLVAPRQPFVDAREAPVGDGNPDERGRDALGDGEDGQPVARARSLVVPLDHDPAVPLDEHARDAAQGGVAGVRAAAPGDGRDDCENRAKTPWHPATVGAPPT